MLDVLERIKEALIINEDFKGIWKTKEGFLRVFIIPGYSKAFLTIQKYCISNFGKYRQLTNESVFSFL